jgi:predicted nucleotidyltransferase
MEREFAPYLRAWRRCLREIESRRRREAERLLAHAIALARLLGEQFNVERGYLFGSLVRGDFKEGSDIDLGVEGLAPGLYFQALARLYEASPGLHIDLIPLESSDIQEEIVKEGEVIYERSGPAHPAQGRARP